MRLVRDPGGNLAEELQNAGVQLGVACDTTLDVVAIASGWRVWLTDELGRVTTVTVATLADTTPVAAAWFDRVIEPSDRVLRTATIGTSTPRAAPAAPRTPFWYAVGGSAARSADGAVWWGPLVSAGWGPIGIVAEPRFDTEQTGALAGSGVSRAHYAARVVGSAGRWGLRFEAALGEVYEVAAPSLVTQISRSGAQTWSGTASLGVSYAILDRVVVALRHEWLLDHEPIDYQAPGGMVRDDPRSFASLSLCFVVAP